MEEPKTTAGYTILLRDQSPITFECEGYNLSNGNWNFYLKGSNSGENVLVAKIASSEVIGIIAYEAKPSIDGNGLNC